MWSPFDLESLSFGVTLMWSPLSHLPLVAFSFHIVKVLVCHLAKGLVCQQQVGGVTNREGNPTYGVATISGLFKIIGLFCRIS